MFYECFVMLHDFLVMPDLCNTSYFAMVVCVGLLQNGLHFLVVDLFNRLLCSVLVAVLAGNISSSGPACAYKGWP